MKGFGTGLTMKAGRTAKAVCATLALGLGMTACSRDYTVAYLYATSAGNATVNAYSVDFQSGALQQLADSPISEVTGGGTPNINPVSLVAAPNGLSVYVVNHDSSTIKPFSVGTDGKLFAGTDANVVNGNGLIGSFPMAAAIDPLGKFLYVVFTFQNGFTQARPGPGGIAIFPLSASGAIGAPVITNGLPYVPVGFNPVGITVSPKPNAAGSYYVYVIDQDFTSTGAPLGTMLAFTQNAATSGLTPILGPLANGGFSVGTTPAGIAAEPLGVYIYVTDQATNQVYAYQNQQGNLTPLTSGVASTGQFPQGITVDPRGHFVYVANAGSSTVSIYNIASGGGLTGTGQTSVAGTGPTCVTIEPALGIYLYTSNRIDNSIGAGQLDPHNGSLKQVQGTQFSAQSLPSCVVAVANGAHATQLVN